MKKFFILSIVILLVIFSTHAQFTRYIIKLKDKNTNPYSLSNPSQYLTGRALQRRTRYGIAIDSTDLPITPRYVDSIKLAGAVTILNYSKWLNQVAIQTTDAAALAKINSFPFVLSQAPIAAIKQSANKTINKKMDSSANNKITTTALPQNILSNYYNYGQSFAQIHLHNGEFLHNHGFRGQGMILTMLDAGYTNFLQMTTFDSIRNNNQVLGKWNFVTRDTNIQVYPHGSNCLSTIAANMPGTFIGTAPQASFYLYCTEDVSSEYPVEEQNWAVGLEKADSLGVDITSTSLGYTTFDNAIFNPTYTNMDGHTTIAAIAANIAAKKGMLLVVAAGNDGTDSWHYIGTPADADSVMAIGAVDVNGVVGSFSSYGPSSDGQIKPSVAAVGVNAVVANVNTGLPSYGNGTSFACPNMAGLSTCLWQAFPEVNNMTIINILQQSANNFSTPNDRIGYGIPDMKKAFVLLEKQLFTKQITQSNCKTNLQLTAKTDSTISIVIEKKLLTDANYIAINTINSTGGFSAKNFSYNDDLSNANSAIIKYRFKMSIGTDTAFYLDSASLNFTPKPNLGADKNIVACNNSTVNLTTQFITTGTTTAWTLNGATITNPVAINTAGTYQLIATNTSGCADTAIATISFNATPNLGADKIATKCTDSSFNLTTTFITTGLISNWSVNAVPVAIPASVTTAGVYQLIATNNLGCSDTALLTLNNDAAICPALIEKIIISPNPVTDKLNIAITKKVATKIDIEITNAIGQKMYANSYQQPIGTQNYLVPMRQLAAGAYFVSVFVNEEKVVTKKIITK